MSKPIPLFRTTNWSSYSRALKRRGSLMVWFDPEMAWFAVPSGKAGHPERFSAAAIQFCLSIKVLFGLPLRQTTGFVESMLALSGLDWPVPDYTTLCRRQKHLKVQIPYRSASGPLHLLVDSTGIKFSGEGEWQVRKHGASRRRQWRKIHIGIDADTLEVRAVEITSNRIGDVEPAKRHRFERTGEGYCRICWHRSRQRNRSAASPPMASMIPRVVTSLSRPEVQMLLSRPAGMPGTGRDRIPACKPAMRPCTPADASAGPTGRNCPDITDEVGWRPK